MEGATEDTTEEKLASLFGLKTPGRMADGEGDLNLPPLLLLDLDSNLGSSFLPSFLPSSRTH